MIFLGCDPDLHNCPVAAVDELGKLVWVSCFKIPLDLTEDDAVIEMCSKLACTTSYFGNKSVIGKVFALAVEAQNYYNTPDGRKVDVRDILRLASVAGGALTALYHAGPEKVYFPDPVQWKGNVEKLLPRSCASPRRQASPPTPCR